MTLDELNHNYELHRMLQDAVEMVAALRQTAEPGAQIMTGMPSAHEPGDKVGKLAVSIADGERYIEAIRQELRRTEGAVLQFIREIPNLQTRTIFRLRFVEAMAWGDIADALRYSKNTIKMRVYRYVREKCDRM